MLKAASYSRLSSYWLIIVVVYYKVTLHGDTRYMKERSTKCITTEKVKECIVLPVGH